MMKQKVMTITNWISILLILILSLCFAQSYKAEAASDMAEQCWIELWAIEDAEQEYMQQGRSYAELHKLWDDELNVLWGHLREMMGQSEFQNLTQEELNWIYANSNDLENYGERGYYLVKERTYYLMNYVPGGQRTRPDALKEYLEGNYGRIVSQYQEMVKAGYYREVKLGSIDELPGYIVTQAYLAGQQDPSYRIFLAMYDFNGDTAKDCVLVGGTDSSGLSIIDAYTYGHGGEYPMRVLPEEMVIGASDLVSDLIEIK